MKREAARVRVDGSSARVLVEIEREPNPASPKGQARLELVFQFVRDGEKWQLRGAASPALDFCRRFDEAPTAEARLSLLRIDRIRPNRDTAILLNQLAFENGILGEDAARGARWNELAFEVAARLEDKLAEAWCQLNRACLREARKEFDAARADLEVALAVFRKVSERNGEGVAMVVLQRVLSGLGQHAKAYEVNQAAWDGPLLVTGYAAQPSTRASGVVAWTQGRLDDQAVLEDEIIEHIAAGGLETALLKVDRIEAIERALFSPINIEIRGTCRYRAQIQARLGDYPAAVEAARRAKQMAVAITGASHWRPVDDQVLADTYSRLGALQKGDQTRYWRAVDLEKEGTRLFRIRQFAKAAPVLEEASREIAEVAPNSMAHPRALYSLGEALRWLDRYDEAERAYRDARALFIKAGMPVGFPDHVSTLRGLMWTLEAKSTRAEAANDLRAARRWQEEALAVATTAHGKVHYETLAPRWKLEHLLRLSDLTAEERARARAAEVVIAKVKAARNAQPPAISDALAGELREACRTLQELFGEDDRVVYKAWDDLLGLFQALRRYKDMIAISEKQHAWLRRQKADELGHPDFCDHLMMSGTIAFVLNRDLIQARHLTQQAYDLFRRSDEMSRQGYRDCISLLVMCHEEIGDLPAAIDIQMAELARLRRSIFGSGARGLVIKSLTPELLQKKSPRTLELLASTYLSMGLQWSRNGEPGKGEWLVFEAARIYSLLEGRAKRRADALLDLTDVRIRLGHHDEAANSLEEAAKILGETASVMRSRVSLSFAQQNFAAAHSVLLKRLQLAERTDMEAVTHPILEDLILTERLLGNVDAYARAKRLLESKQRQTRLSPIFQTEQQAQDALTNDKTLDHLIGLALAAPADAEHRETALRWVLRRKGLLLETLCRFREDWQLATVDPALAGHTDQLRDVQERLNHLSIRSRPEDLVAEREIKALKGTVERLQSEIGRALAKKRPDRFRRLDSADPASVREAMPDGTVLVEFVRYRPLREKPSAGNYWEADHYVVFVLPKKEGAEVRLVDLGPAETIDAAVEDLRREISLPSVPAPTEERRLERDCRKKAKAVYDLLLEKVAASLGNGTTLLISPEGSLHLLPFAALVEPSGKYLIETRRCQYLTCGRDLLRPAPSTDGDGVVVFANPDYNLPVKDRLALLAAANVPPTAAAALPPRRLEGGGLKHWEPLGGSEREAEFICKALTGGRFGTVEKPFVGPRALKEFLKGVKSPRVLHLATHGFYYPYRKETYSSGTMATLMALQNPLLRSGVVMAGANTPPDPAVRAEDGLMMAEEVAQLDLRGTELVVLSACETGLSDANAWQGANGLRRALMHAGARSMVTTMHKVPDDESAELMKAFYTHLASGRGRAQALHDAELGLLLARREKNGGVSHPFFWAGFTYTGEP